MLGITSGNEETSSRKEMILSGVAWYQWMCLIYVNSKYSFLSYFFQLYFYFYFFNIFIDYAITVVPFSAPPHSTPSCPPSPSHIPPYSSCPWVILISSLASTFPTLFLPSPCLFSTYHLCYLFSVPFPASPPPTPLLTTLHVISISMVLFLF